MTIFTETNRHLSYFAARLIFFTYINIRVKFNDEYYSTKQYLSKSLMKLSIHMYIYCRQHISSSSNRLSSITIQRHKLLFVKEGVKFYAPLNKNRSFWTCFSQAIRSLGTEKTKPNITKSNTVTERYHNTNKH